MEGLQDLPRRRFFATPVDDKCDVAMGQKANKPCVRDNGLANAGPFSHRRIIEPVSVENK
jgi:hypothetical protein